ncbi:hypothetical protein [Pseudotabrizicola sp.]|uniref:hypothetical protein n=1 Tax=Pseudotabrizicola sp. TaxID=2939647 RepID=UPI00271FBD4E|nr:hypothetical protein [Pseudotabrizicola sp.]MDO8885276.1 hypothetical protein [Pseudotabrizicola sp.]MDP2079532.1 hypothetical protein [Pseudotabrizicola sp.]
MQAAAILQTYLDEIAAAVMAGDFVAYRVGVVLPFHLVTHTANMTISTEDDLRVGFETFCGMLKSQRVTDYIRLVESAQDIDSSLITGRYVSHLISGGMRVIDPFHSQITLRHDEGRWRAASITNALANSRWPVLMPSLATPDLRKGPEE